MKSAHHRSTRTGFCTFSSDDALISPRLLFFIAIPVSGFFFAEDQKATTISSRHRGSPFLSSILSKVCRSIDLTFYRLSTRLAAAYKLLKLSDEDIQKFLASYTLFKGVDMRRKDEKLAVDYYYVMNNLCALGNIEKMYIPPLMDKRYGIIGNQELYERRWRTWESDQERKCLILVVVEVELPCTLQKLWGHLSKESI